MAPWIVGLACHRSASLRAAHGTASGLVRSPRGDLVLTTTVLTMALYRSGQARAPLGCAFRRKQTGPAPSKQPTSLSNRVIVGGY